MKKLLVILCTLLLGLCLAACSADPNKKVTLKIVDNTGSEEVFEANGQNTTLEGLLDSIAATGIITYEKSVEEEGTYIVSINGLPVDTNGHNSWTIYVNGENTGETINDQEIKDGDTYEIVYVDENQQSDPTLVGSWKTFETANIDLSDDEKAIFEKALDGIVGVGYTPIRVLATQTVNGINYAYLAQGITVTAQPQTDYYIITVYVDQQGNGEIKAINKLDVTNIESKEEETQPAVGSWLIRSTGKALMLPDENIQLSFDKATEQLVGVRYNPAQLLASQLVSGNNYCALCLGVPAAENPATNLYVVTWYADLQGNSTVTDVKLLNLEYYTSGE